MHDRRTEIEGRVARVMEQRITPAIHVPLAELTVEVWHVPPAEDGKVGEPVPFATAREAAYEACQIGERWGPAWGTSWFHVTGQAPAADDGDLEIILDLGWSPSRPGMQAEALVHRPDGTLVKGLNPLNNWIPIQPGERIDLYVEAAANPAILAAPGGSRWTPTTIGDRLTAGEQPIYRLDRAQITRREVELDELRADIDVLSGLAGSLSEDSERRWEILYALDRALDRLDVHDLAGTAAEARAELTPSLSRPAYGAAQQITAIGHAHIDSAWLWPVRETVRKVSRTLANVVHLMETDESLIHCMSSAQQWAWVAEHQPELFARAKALVEAGRLVPTGGMWVESDTNMVGGEAMVRQFLYGKRWFAEHLGVDIEEVWLPDSFGYTAALPQIVKLAGFRWFLTQKISWNTVNPFPHHTFWWEGIDGTRVFTHFPPADTYNGTLEGKELAHSATNFRDKGAATQALLPFGHGDGGGGPTREMLARARRTTSLAGSPQVQIASPRSFFEAAEAEYADAPVWAGELYLEIHRGTYTSQARTKQGNRRSEHLLRAAELWATTAAVRGVADYPRGALDEAWQTVLLNQFHDILPGSSIAWVHRDAEAAYERVAETLTGLIESRIEALSTAATGPAAGESPGTVEATAATCTATKSGFILANESLRVEVADTGVIGSIRDLVEGREVLPPGGVAALLQLHPDQPNKWDAWDIDRFYRHRVSDLVGSAHQDGDEIVVDYEFGSSTAQLRLVLPTDGSRALDVSLDVDWHERETVLKLAFDVDVHTSEARYETQFGHVVRPTHDNTSWDAARFEVCAHRWVQVGESDYGVALANDSTYGHDITRHPRQGGGTFSRVRATVLRAPRYPDPETDQGRHHFGYRLVAGAGVAEAAEAGYALNVPGLNLPGPEALDAPAIEPLLSVQSCRGTAYIEAVKLAEDHSGDVIVRLFEPLGARAEVSLVTTFDHGAVREVDLLERDLTPDALVDPASMRLQMRPFQIVTIRISRPDSR